MTDFTWGYIGTVAGASAAVMLIVQLINSITGKEISKWWLRLLTYGLSVLLLDVALAFTGWSFDTFALNFLNGIVVYFTATGGYHTILKEIKALKGNDEA